KVVALDLEGNIFVPGRGTAVERRVDERPEYVPDLAPALADGLAQPPWVLRAEHRPVRIVVDGNVLRSPPQEQREAVREQKTDHHPQRGRPWFDGAERRLRPVERANALAHLPAAGEEVVADRHRASALLVKPRPEPRKGAAPPMCPLCQIRRG